MLQKSLLLLLGLGLATIWGSACSEADKTVEKEEELATDLFVTVDCTNTAANIASPLTSRILAAKSGDSLEIKGTCFGNFIIDKDLKLFGERGSSAPPAFIRGVSTNASVLTIGPGTKVEISKLTITNGRAVAGGGIKNSGHLILRDDAIIMGNRATFGGGIHSFVSQGVGKVEMFGTSRVYANIADSAGGGIYFGAQNGARSTALLSDMARVFGNTARDGGGIKTYAYNPGSVAEVTIEGKAFVSGNAAAGFTETLYPIGGGLMIDADDKAIARAFLLADSSVHGNVSKKSGGGIVVSAHGEADASIELRDNAVVSGNVANEQGGGIYTTNAESTVNGRTSVNLLNNARVVGNVANQQGAGIAAMTTGTLTGTPLNSVSLGNFVAVQFNTSRIFPASQDIHMASNLIKDGRPVGVALADVDCDSDDLQARLNAWTGATIRVVGNCVGRITVRQNIAIEGVWRRRLNDEQSRIGFPKISLLAAQEGTAVTVEATARTVTLKNIGITGGQFANPNCSAVAGGISVNQSGNTLNLENVTVFASKAPTGGIYNKGSTLNLTKNSSVSGNSGCIGGITNTAGATLNLSDNSTVSGNGTTPTTQVGGILNELSTLNLFHQAGICGNVKSGILNWASAAASNSATVLNGSSQIVANSAPNGGGIFNSAAAVGSTASVTLNENAVLLQNNSDVNGGGIFNYVGTGSSIVNLRGSAAILANTAPTGAGINNSNGTLNIASTAYFKYNTADQCYSTAPIPQNCLVQNP